MVTEAVDFSQSSLGLPVESLKHVSLITPKHCEHILNLHSLVPTPATYLLIKRFIYGKFIHPKSTVWH